MNNDAVKQFKMPTLGQFQKLLLDQINLWGNSAPELNFTKEPTEKDNKKALAKMFESFSDRPFSLNDLMRGGEKFAPQDKQLNTKLKSVQKNFQQLAKDDYYSKFEYDDMEQYIKKAISVSFDDPELSQFSNEIRKWLIERYKFFTVNLMPTNASNASLIYFINGFALPAVIEKIHLFKLIKKEGFCFSATKLIPNLVNGKVTQWPLAALLDELCTKANTTKYKLTQFHTLKDRDTKNVNYSDIWQRLPTEKNIEVCTKSKQRIERINRLAKIKWADLWEVIEPLQCLLPNTTLQQFKFDAFIVFLFHSAFQSLHKQMNCRDYENITANASKLIEASLEKSQIIQNKLLSIKDDDQQDYIEESFMIEKETLIEFAHKNGFSLGEQASLEELHKAQPQYHYEIIQFELCAKDITDNAAFTHGLTHIVHSEFWQAMLHQPQSIYQEHLSYFEEDIKRLNCDWMLNWFYARMAILTSDIPKSLTHFMLAFTQAKYQSGQLFNLLILDVSAFCKIQYQLMRQQGNAADYDQLYEPLGDGIHKWSALTGYTVGWKRHNLMPYNLGPEESARLNADIEATKRAMEQAIGALLITGKEL